MIGGFCINNVPICNLSLFYIEAPINSMRDLYVSSVISTREVGRPRWFSWHRIDGAQDWLGELDFRMGGALKALSYLSSIRTCNLQIISMSLDTATNKLESVPDQQTSETASTPNKPLITEQKKQLISGNGIIEYVYYPKKGKTQRVCGILGKDKRVSHPSLIHKHTV